MQCDTTLITYKTGTKVLIAMATLRYRTPQRIAPVYHKFTSFTPITFRFHYQDLNKRLINRRYILLQLRIICYCPAFLFPWPRSAKSAHRDRILVKKQHTPHALHKQISGKSVVQDFRFSFQVQVLHKFPKTKVFNQWKVSGKKRQSPKSLLNTNLTNHQSINQLITCLTCVLF